MAEADLFCSPTAGGDEGSEGRDGDAIHDSPQASSRRQTFEDYMRAYANGEVRRARDGDDDHPSATTDHEPDEPQRPNQQQQQQQVPRTHAELTATPEYAAYTLFLQHAQHRALQRHDLATRERIWAEATARARARLAGVSAEKVALQAKLAGMERERERYRAVHAVEVSEVEDRRERRRWEEWLRVEWGVVFGRAGEGEGAAGGGGVEEEEEGGVEI